MVVDDRDRLGELLKNTGLRQQDIAEEIGCTQPYISQMVCGTRPVTATVLAVAEELARERMQALEAAVDGA